MNFALTAAGEAQAGMTEDWPQAVAAVRYAWRK